MNFKEKLKELQKIIPIKYRVGSGSGSYVMGGDKKDKKIYGKYIILPYINSRDCQDRLDEVFEHERSRTYKDIGGKAYCEVALRDGIKRIPRSDVGEPTAIARNKGESSDAFKRACVNWGLGRFLYTMPVIILTKDEVTAHQYDLTAYIKEKYKKTLSERQKQSGFEILDKNSKYTELDDEENLLGEIETPDIPMEEAMDGITAIK